jgi:hypothetical protein
MAELGTGLMSTTSIFGSQQMNTMEKGGNVKNRMMDRFFERTGGPEDEAADIADIKHRFQEKMQCLLEAEEMLTDALSTAKKEV